MSERQSQTEFLKALIRCEDTEQCRHLQERIATAQQDERCLRRFIFLMVLLALLAGAGTCYSAVLLPEFFGHTMPTLVKLFCALGLGALICLVAFLGYWMWHRSIVNGLHQECRRFVLAMLKDQARTTQPPSASEFVQPRPSTLYQSVTRETENNCAVFHFAPSFPRQS